MSDRLEHALAPYVTFLVMPIFALANAGVVIESAAYFDIFHRAPETGAVGMGVFFGLLAGKPLGIFSRQLVRRAHGSCRDARRGDVAHAAGRGVSGRHRVHDVAVRRFAGLLRSRGWSIAAKSPF